MTKYINGDRLLTKAHELYVQPNIKLWQVVNLIGNEPAADVVEVKHGRWLPQIVLGQKAWDCSECKTLGSPQWNWCPICGAKMDGERRKSNGTA